MYINNNIIDGGGLTIYHIFLKEIQNNNSTHKKSMVLISKNLTLDNFNNITPTLQEALDIIEIEEIERSLNI